MRTKIVAGNWKMHLEWDGAQALASEIVTKYETESQRKVEVILAPPFPFLKAVQHLVKGNPRFGVAAQNMHQAPQGAFTGEISGGMIASLGCSAVILGHSERRQFFGETNSALALKVAAALGYGLRPIYCVGETLAEREAGQTLAVVGSQLREALAGLAPDQAARLIVAYEPVWAIGTGKVATPAQAQEVHAFIRRELASLFGAPLSATLPILYGGSVKGDNARELFGQEDIDGGLVGGASLKSADFVQIILAAED